jgi:hypothetical protein
MANFEKLEAIAEGMLKVGEKIEAKVAGSYSNESAPGNHEIVKGFMAATNQRVLVVLNSVSLSTRKDSFTYGQVATPPVLNDGTLDLTVPGERITLFNVVEDCDDPEKFKKFITEKKTPVPKTTILARDVEIPPPQPKK